MRPNGCYHNGRFVSTTTTVSVKHVLCVCLLAFYRSVLQPHLDKRQTKRISTPFFLCAALRFYRVPNDGSRAVSCFPHLAEVAALFC